MHVTIAYHGDSKRALKDMEEYLGERRWNACIEYAREENASKEALRVALALIAGVEGYPAKCFIEKYMP